MTMPVKPPPPPTPPPVGHDPKPLPPPPTPPPVGEDPKPATGKPPAKPRGPAKPPAKTRRRAVAQAVKDRERSAGRTLARAADTGAVAPVVSLGGSILTWIGMGLALVLLIVLLRSATAAEGLLGFARSAVSWFVSPTAGIWS